MRMRDSPVLRDLSLMGTQSHLWGSDSKSDKNFPQGTEASQIPLRSHLGLQIPNHLLVLGPQVCVWWPNQAWMCRRVPH